MNDDRAVTALQHGQHRAPNTRQPRNNPRKKRPPDWYLVRRAPMLVIEGSLQPRRLAQQGLPLEFAVAEGAIRRIVLPRRMLEHRLLRSHNRPARGRHLHGDSR